MVDGHHFIINVEFIEVAMGMPIFGCKHNKEVGTPISKVHAFYGKGVPLPKKCKLD